MMDHAHMLILVTIVMEIALNQTLNGLVIRITMVSLVLTQNPDVNLELLREFYPISAPPMDHIIRTIVGMDHEAVEKRFADFSRKYSEGSQQTLFLRLLKNHIKTYGAITVEKLYEEPFTTLSSDGLDGVFENDAQIEELISILETFQPHQELKG